MDSVRQHRLHRSNGAIPSRVVDDLYHREISSSTAFVENMTHQYRNASLGRAIIIEGSALSLGISTPEFGKKSALITFDRLLPRLSR